MRALVRSGRSDKLLFHAGVCAETGAMHSEQAMVMNAAIRIYVFLDAEFRTGKSYSV